MEGAKLGGFFIYLLFSNQALRKEAAGLKERAAEIMQIFMKNFTKRGQKKFEEKAYTFFSGQLGSLAVSKKMEFLLQGFALTRLRKPIKQDKKGVIYTATETGYLSLFSKLLGGQPFNSWQKNITQYWTKEFTALSVALIREEAEKITCLEANKKERLRRMLSEACTHIYTPDPQFEVKTFGCCFYEYQAIITRLKEENGLVGFKNIVSEGRPFLILLQGQNKEGNFTIFAQEEYSMLDPKAPLVVFEGATTLHQDELRSWIASITFEKMILAFAAKEPPYEPNSDLESIEDEEAKKEILFYREIMEKQVEDKVVLDHVYCNLLVEEVANETA
jgi:hypothetical protein